MSTQQRRIPKGETILVTGANGYIATHIIDLLLEQGYKVRGTVRNENPSLNKYFVDKYGKERFETVIVAALAEVGAFDQAIEGVAGVVHVAADVTFNKEVDKIVAWAVQATTNLLKAAAKEPSVKSVVLTSSSSACLMPKPNVEKAIEENTWNDEVLAAMKDPNTPEFMLPFYGYCAQKLTQEREFFKWAREHKPGFVVNSVVPNLNIGEVLILDGNMSSCTWIRNALKGENPMETIIPPEWFVDVRDDARLHVAALLDPTVENERVFAFAHTFTWGEIYSILRKLRPDNEKIPANPENEGQDLSTVKGRGRAEELIKSFFGVKGWTTLEQSVAAAIKDLQ